MARGGRPLSQVARVRAQPSRQLRLQQGGARHHVDDFLATCVNRCRLLDLAQRFQDRFGEVKSQSGDVLSYVGTTIQIERTDESVSVRMTMGKAIGDILAESAVEGVAQTPAADNIFDVKDAPLLSEDRRKRLHRLVAMTLYTAQRVRPDLLLPVSFLSSRVTCATEDDDAKLTRMLRYLNGTREVGIVLSCSLPILLSCYADASFAVHSDRKSHSADLCKIGDGLVSARSYKQKLVTKSSGESEFVCGSDAVSTAVGHRNFLIEQGHEMPPVVLYQDNTSAIALAQKGKPASDRTRHVDIRYFFVKDMIDSGDFAIEYLASDMMLADVLTKPIQGARYVAMRDQLLNWH